MGCTRIVVYLLGYASIMIIWNCMCLVDSVWLPDIIAGIYLVSVYKLYNWFNCYSYYQGCIYSSRNVALDLKLFIAGGCGKYPPWFKLRWGTEVSCQLWILIAYGVGDFKSMLSTTCMVPIPGCLTPSLGIVGVAWFISLALDQLHIGGCIFLTFLALWCP